MGATAIHTVTTETIPTATPKLGACTARQPQCPSRTNPHRINKVFAGHQIPLSGYNLHTFIVFETGERHIPRPNQETKR